MRIFRRFSRKQYYVKLELKGKYHEIGPQMLKLSDMSAQKYFRFDLFYEHVERILADRSVKRVLVHRWSSFSVPVFGGLEEIHSALRRLTAAGIDVWYFASEFSTIDCVLSSACSHRILHPLGQVSFLGRQMSSVFFRKMLDEYSVEVTVIRRDKFKSAADPLRTEKYDEFARKQYQSLLDGVVKSMRESIIGGRRAGEAKGFTEKILDEMLGGRIFNSEEALEIGLVDELSTCDQLTNRWQTESFREERGRKLRGWFGSGKHVAVLVLEGMIAEGGNRRSPVFGQAVGDRPMVRMIRSLRKSKRVKGVVFRINSGGGSAVASENILRELEALHRTKPLVISMGPVAGSGGYWVATTGRRLYALPTSITGSIGVLALFFNISALLRNYGLTTDVIKHGDSADMGSVYRPLTEKEKDTIDATIEFLYRKFIDQVAVSRKISPEKVNELGEGRVWLGQEAYNHGLVDEPGGLHEALDQLRKELNTEKIRVVFAPRQPFLARLLTRQGASTDAGINEPAHLSGSLNQIQVSILENGRPVFDLIPEIIRTYAGLNGKPLFIDPWLSQIASGIS